MILVQLLSTIVMLVLAVGLAPHGTVWVAAAWGIGHLVGGVARYVVTVTVARFPDDAPVASTARRPSTSHEEPAAQPRPRRRSSGRSASPCGCSRGVVPQSRSVVARGFPETEGNGVEVARALVWSSTTAAWSGCASRARCPGTCGRSPTEGMVLVPQGEPRRALGLPARRGGALHPRALRQPAARARASRSSTSGTATVRRTSAPTTGVGGADREHLLRRQHRSCSPQFQAAAFGVPADRVLVTGNPRTDQLWRRRRRRAAGSARHHR